MRTAELLEIKGLLKDDAAWPPQGLASLFQAGPVSPGPSQKTNSSLPSLPTVPVSSFLLPTGNTTSIVSGHITEGTQIHDLVSQIKVPVTLPSQPVSKTLLTSNSMQHHGEKRRKIEIRQQAPGRTNNSITIVNNNGQSQAQKARRLMTATSANAVTTQIVVEDNSVSF